MTTQNCFSGESTNSFTRSLRLFLWANFSTLAITFATQAQTSSLGIKMIPVTLTLPQLQLNATLGTTNVLEVSTNLTAWQDLTTLAFTTTNILLWVDKYPRESGAYYRLRRVTNGGGNNPPFPPPVTNLVWIAPGQFVLGSPASDLDALSEETPQTSVTLTKGFFMGKYEVTQGQYLAATGSNPSNFGGNTNLPVESVTWNQATNFCRLLNIQENVAGRLPAGYAYRLPTEAEWEYAARAGATNRFSWGDDLGYSALGNYAWNSLNSGGNTHVVGQKLQNAWGLYDMSGNVSEWCQDSDWTYPGGSVTNPVPSNASNQKIFRGGSHADDGISCRAAHRNRIAQNTSLNIFGLRVVLAQTAP